MSRRCGAVRGRRVRGSTVDELGSIIEGLIERIVAEDRLADPLTSSFAQVQGYQLLGVAWVSVITTWEQICIADITRWSRVN